jgi:hypothetical protein
MRPESRRIIHIGINFVFSPSPDVNSKKALEFQQALVSRGVDYENAERTDQQVKIIRKNPPLEIMVSAALPQQPVGQLLIVAPNPVRPLGIFIEEVEEVIRAFEGVWPTQQRQIIKSDTALRDLYETQSEHAFQELWENMLHQDIESLRTFGSVLGGGLRLVMPPNQGDAESAQIEVKIESYLRDTSKFFVETQFVWSQPMTTRQAEDFKARDKLEQTDRYSQNQVLNFMRKE